MFYGYDRTGFPLIPMFETGIEVHLLPVTKIQFEYFLKATGRSDDAGGEEMLRELQWSRNPIFKLSRLMLVVPFGECIPYTSVP